jgi:hypothetical protein
VDHIAPPWFVGWSYPQTEEAPTSRSSAKSAQSSDKIELQTDDANIRAPFVMIQAFATGVTHIFLPGQKKQNQFYRGCS